MGTVRFELRTDKKDKLQRHPVRMVYQVRGDRAYYNTGSKCVVENWGGAGQRFVFRKTKAGEGAMSDREVRVANMALDALERDILDIETRLSLDKKPIKAKGVIEELNRMRPDIERKDDPGTRVTAFIERFVSEGTEKHKLGTLKAYSGVGRHLAGFEKAKKVQVTFENLDRAMFKAFESYLVRGEKGMLNVTAAKQISTLKTLINYARRDYKIVVNPDYQDYAVSRGDSGFEVITLTKDELDLLFSLDLSGNPRLDRVRDVFCFSCATGLRYSDVKQLRREHVRGDVIKLTIAKTGQVQEVPLNAYSAAILEKYKGSQKVLPIGSNQPLNRYLKELGQLAGIDTPIEIVRFKGVERVVTMYPKFDLISMHTGRKTFTTLSLEMGMAAQEVMAITGHKTWAAFKRYVDVANKRRKAVMHEVWGKPESKLKAV